MIAGDDSKTRRFWPERFGVNSTRKKGPKMWFDCRLKERDRGHLPSRLVKDRGWHALSRVRAWPHRD